MQIESVCDWAALIKVEISHIFYTKVHSKVLNSIISDSQSRRSNPVILKFATAHHPVIIFHWTKIKLESRLKIPPKLPSQEINAKSPCCESAGRVRTCRPQRRRLIFQHLMGITIELGAKVQKSTRIPINHILKHLRDTRENVNAKADTALRMQVRRHTRSERTYKHTHTKQQRVVLVVGVVARGRGGRGGRRGVGNTRCQQLQPGWLPSKARAASTR